MQKTNKEGVTYASWIAAATLCGKFSETPSHRKAWRNGEDPTEWAAAAEKSGEGDIDDE